MKVDNILCYPFWLWNGWCYCSVTKLDSFDL